MTRAPVGRFALALLVGAMAACGDEAPLAENVRPVAVFEAPSSGVVGVEVVVDGTASTDEDGYVAYYTFVWDDGSPEEISRSPIGRHTYAAGLIGAWA